MTSEAAALELEVVVLLRCRLRETDVLVAGRRIGAGRNAADLLADVAAAVHGRGSSVLVERESGRSDQGGERRDDGDVAGGRHGRSPLNSAAGANVRTGCSRSGVGRPCASVSIDGRYIALNSIVYNLIVYALSECCYAQLNCTLSICFQDDFPYGGRDLNRHPRGWP